MRNLKTIMLLLLAAAINTINAQEKYSKVKIYNDPANTFAQRSFVYGELQIDHCHFEDGAYVVEIGEAELNKLKASPYRYSVVVDDVAADFRRRNDVSKFYDGDQTVTQNRAALVQSCKTVDNIIPTPVAFIPGAMGGYYTYFQMDSIMTALETNYPGLIDKFSIGTSLEGRTIWCVKISDNVATDETEPEVFFNALQHCREAISGTSQIFFMEYLLENYATDLKVRQLVDAREIFIVPCVNPDGYVYNQTTNPNGGGNWRKNRRPLGGGEFGVDLNRNYNADWADCNPPIGGFVANCGSGAATSANSTYWGTGPFSEPETQAIRDFTAARNFLMSIDQHSEGAYNTVPHGRSSLHPTHNAIDSQFLYGFSSSTFATYDCHRIGNNLQTLNYEVAGGNKDWMFQGLTSMASNPRKIYSFTSEAGGGSFWPLSSQIIPLAKGLCFQFIQAAITAGGYADIQDQNDITLTALSGNMGYSVRRIGIMDKQITVQMLPLENMASAGAAVVIPSIATYNTTVSGNIAYTLPATLGTGQRIRFIWRVTCDGISVSDTVTKFYNPVTVLYDDMETGAATARWTIGGGTGWAYGTAHAFAGSRSLTESVALNYSPGVTRTATYTTAINLSDATASYLSFWVRHRSENCMDNLRIQISTNGGGSYTNVCGRHTISENAGNLGGQPALTGIRENWTRELVDLSSFIGAGMNNLRLRFSFSSNANDPSDPYYKEEDEGFYLDNVHLIKSTNTLITLGVHFTSFDGKILPNGTAELNWEAATDNQHDHFEIERSTDGQNFITLGLEDKLSTSNAYQFIDGSVQRGRNYYRIKQLDKDGKATYSRIVNLYVDPGKTSFSVFPNPTSGIIKVSFNGNAGEAYTITLSDLLGKKVHEEKVITGSSLKIVNIDLTEKKASVLMLTIRNSSNEIITTEKILKY
jgi:carboxypeptidase T